MAETYKDYIHEWLKGNPEPGESPKDYHEWERENYFATCPAPAEWEETKELYAELYNIAKRIEDIRVILYNNRVHRQLCDDSWKEKDKILFTIQSELWASDGEDCFGAYELMGYY